MHRAATSSGLVAVVLALGFVSLASCAKGNDASTAEGAAATPVEGDAGPDAACAPCFADQVCSAGECVSVDTDADKDGVKAGVDCDDHDPAIHPGAAEICNGKDDNCDGKIDEGFDQDNDGTPSCAVSGKPADCDDHDPAIHPGAPEVCNGKDDNCDGKVDEGFDADNDGFYACAHGTIPVDCDDTIATIHPGAPETCNTKDDDCNGVIDDIPATLNGQLTSPINPHWQLAGSAGLGAAGSAAAGWAQLTPDSPDQSGALWWNALYNFDVFDVSSTFWIQQKANGADGMTFAWVMGGNVNQVGGGAGGLGIAGLQGYSVVIDTFTNAGEPAAPYLAIMQNAATPVPLATAVIPDVRNSTEHRLRVTLGIGGKVSVWIDTVNRINEFVIPGYTPFTGHWGFTGATGGASEAHWVKDITMSFPNGQGCVL